MKRLAHLLFLFAAACSDPAAPGEPAPDPCAPVFACRSPGVDLEVVAVSVTGTQSDSVTKLLIIQPDSIPVRFTIRNLGTMTAAAGEVELSFGASTSTGLKTKFVPYPSLAPGAEHRDSVTVTAEREGGSNLTDDRMYLTARVSEQADTAWRNDSKFSALFHLAIPILKLTFTTAPSVITGQTIQLNVAARNYGLHADAPSQPMTACLYDNFRGCEPMYRTTAGGWTLPVIPAGMVKEFQTTLTIPATAVWQDASTHYSLNLCRGQPLSYNEFECGLGSRSLEVWPDYESVCAPPVLTIAVPVVVNAYNCGIRPSLAGHEAETRMNRFHIVSFDAEAGVTYVIQRSNALANLRLYSAGGLPILDLDGDAGRIRVETAQRIYFVMYSDSETMNITITGAP